MESELVVIELFSCKDKLNLLARELHSVGLERAAFRIFSETYKIQKQLDNLSNINDMLRRIK